MDLKRMGRMLVSRELLSQTQFDHVIETQANRRESFGQVAVKEPGGLNDQQLWDLLAAQVAQNCPRVNLIEEDCDPEVLGLVEVHDAWNYLVLPLRIEDGKLICATTEETAASALAVLDEKLHMPFTLVISEIRLLEQFIAERYAFEGVDLDD